MSDVVAKVVEALNECYAHMAEEELLDGKVTDADTASLASPSLDDV